LVVFLRPNSNNLHLSRNDIRETPFTNQVASVYCELLLHSLVITTLVASLFDLSCFC